MVERKANIFEPEKNFENKINIACYAVGFGFPEGIHTNVTTEAKIPISYGLLLASRGHQVDLITEGGVFHDEPQNFRFIRLAQAQTNYDIAICCQDAFPNPVRADRYIVSFYQRADIPHFKANHKPCICVSRDTTDIPDAALWACPVPVIPRIESNFDKNQLLWVCKHNPVLGSQTIHAKSFQRLLSVLAKLRNKYHTKALFFSQDVGRYFSESIYTGLYYDKLLEELENTKMSLTHTYGSCSLVESVLSGCVPMLWDGVGVKGGDNLRFVPDATLFRIEDSEKEYEAKFDRLLNDRDYYESQWQSFYNIVKVHLPDASYSQFLNIIESSS